MRFRTLSRIASYVLSASAVSILLSPVSAAGFPFTKAENGAREPYGYAPYVWIDVTRCNAVTRWCQGVSPVGFALSVGEYNATSDMCTHYCPGSILAQWRPLKPMAENGFRQYETRGSILGAYVKKVDRTSCHLIPGGFKCSDRVVRNTPLNKVSITLHATRANREYYFSENPSADCEPDPQCAAFKFLKNTLYAPTESRTWPSSEDILTLRNSQYSCVLSYAGLGDMESIATCYAQLGANCFSSGGNRFCISESDENIGVGLTNADGAATAPIAMCQVSAPASDKLRDLTTYPSAEEIKNFLTLSSCDAGIVSLSSIKKYNSTALHFFTKLDMRTLRAVAEAGHLIISVPFGKCLIPYTSGDFSALAESLSEYLTRLKVSTYATGILLDGESGVDCLGQSAWTDGAEFTRVASSLASALIKRGVSRLFLGLPADQPELRAVDFARLLSVFEAFVTPVRYPDRREAKFCQNTWASDDPEGTRQAVVPYLLSLLRRGVGANRIIFKLFLTGVMEIATLETGRGYRSVADLSLADLLTNSAFTCEENLNTRCCTASSVNVLSRDTMVNLTVACTSFETLKRYPKLVATAFGVNQFVLYPIDSDFKRGIRQDTPAILGITSAVHKLRNWKMTASALGSNALTQNRGKRSARQERGGVEELGDIFPRSPDNLYKDPASGSKNCLDPKYMVGLSNRIVCGGLIAIHGAVGIFKEPYKELYATSYDKIYVGNVYNIESCTPGEPWRRAQNSTAPPQVAININTFIPTTDRNHYMVGILNSETVVEYAPPVKKVCNAYSAGEATLHMNLIHLDGGYALDRPELLEEKGVILKPAEAIYFLSNFTPGIDYINLNVSCVDYDANSLKPCLIAVCGGDSGCRRDYGRICEASHEIVNDVRRAGELMREGLSELGAQEKKARMYELPDSAPLPWLEQPRHARRKRFLGFLGLLTGAGALGLAWHVSTRVDHLEKQMDTLKNSHVELQSGMIEVSRKLQRNIVLVNDRFEEQERQMKKNNEVVNANFALLKDAITRNTEAALMDTNVKFSVTVSYQMWYAQMQSITHQLTQAAMQTKFMALGVENCLRQIASKRSGSCPSGLAVMQEHPGLSEFPTVGATLYKDRKLFIVHSVPGTVERRAVRGVIPMPKMSADGVPCWPDYDVWLINGSYYEPSECHGKYCSEPELHARYSRCAGDPSECKTICAPCHRGVCYRDGKVTWFEDSATVEIECPSLETLERTHISDGPVSFADLVRETVPGAPELQVLQAINTSVSLADVRKELDEMELSLKEFDKRYEEMSAERGSVGQFLFGFLANTVSLVWLGLLSLWSAALTAVILHQMCCKSEDGTNTPSLNVFTKSTRSRKGYKRF